MTVSEYLLSCKLTKLSIQELEYMTIGMVFDHFDEWADVHNPQKEKARDATQDDINRLKGR